MVRKTVEVPDKLWREFEVYAVKKFGHYGAIKKALEEAVKLWLEKAKEELQ
ncbi:MAG: hypothetical protein ACXQTI_08690 [Candidatus Nezhaarchaeales archaeon]